MRVFVSTRVYPVHARAWRAWPRSGAGMQESCGHGTSVDRVEAARARSCIGCDRRWLGSSQNSGGWPLERGVAAWASESSAMTPGAARGRGAGAGRMEGELQAGYKRRHTTV